MIHGFINEFSQMNHYWDTKMYLSCYNTSDEDLVLNSYPPIECFHHWLQCYICIEFKNVINNNWSMKQMQEQLKTKIVMHLSTLKILW